MRSHVPRRALRPGKAPVVTAPDGRHARRSATQHRLVALCSHRSARLARVGDARRPARRPVRVGQSSSGLSTTVVSSVATG